MTAVIIVLAWLALAAVVFAALLAGRMADSWDTGVTQVGHDDDD